MRGSTSTGSSSRPSERSGSPDCFVTDEVEYMTADIEDRYIVAPATEPLDENGCLRNKRITCRHRDEIIEVDRERVDYIDISPRMMVSIATAMIPFLENDDANPRSWARTCSARPCRCSPPRRQ